MISGCIDMTEMKVRTTKQFEESTVSKILNLGKFVPGIKIRTFYLQIRQSVYSGSLPWALALAPCLRVIDGLSWTGGSVGRVDLQSLLHSFVISCPCTCDCILLAF